MSRNLGRIFSGIQPSASTPHLGNLIGAIRPWVNYQNETNLKPIFSVVDLHALSNPTIRPDDLYENTVTMTASLLACGLDPKKVIIFQQSTVPQHCELSWILTCCSTLNRLQQLHAWREKVKTLRKGAGSPLGILMYPILMASDILLYKADSVPVGEDQTQHIELTRELAATFNQKYSSDVFTIPEKVVQSESNRIKSLRDPMAKMSKSEGTEGGLISILDSPEAIASKIKKAVTDSNPDLTFDPDNRPGVSNLINIYAALRGIGVTDIGSHIQSLNTLQLKLELADLVVSALNPIRSEHERLLQNRDYLSQVLHQGQQSAMEIAESTLKEVKSVVGLTR